MNRIKDIAAQLPAHGIEAMLVTGEVNRRWATGFKSSAGTLLVAKSASYFITDSRYIEAARAEISGAEVIQIESNRSYTSLLGELLAQHSVRRLGFEENVFTYHGYEIYRTKLAPITLIPSAKIPMVLRQSKSDAEVALLSRAQEITDQTFAEVLPLINPNMTERELAAEIVYRLLKNGAEGISFDPIVASGTRSSMPHATPTDNTLSGFVTMDFGAKHKGYCADMTRTIALGTVTDEMKTVYKTVQQAQTAGIAAARAGVSGKEIDTAARDVICAAGFGDYFGHGFGHGQGMEVHEEPGASQAEKRILPAGAVISAEPGIYLPGKFGVRIEDTLYLKEDGARNLTKSPKHLLML